MIVFTATVATTGRWLGTFATEAEARIAARGKCGCCGFDSGHVWSSNLTTGTVERIL